MKKNLCLSLLTVMLTIGLATAQAIKVHTIGDSTMAQYDPNSTVTRGWGMYLQQFLNGITVNNRGKGGASTRSFYQGSQYWQSVKSQMTAGDYVLIQFAHNDEKNQGCHHRHCCIRSIFGYIFVHLGSGQPYPDST